MARRTGSELRSDLARAPPPCELLPMATARAQEVVRRSVERGRGDCCCERLPPWGIRLADAPREPRRIL